MERFRHLEKRPLPAGPPCLRIEARLRSVQRRLFFWLFSDCGSVQPLFPVSKFCPLRLDPADGLLFG